MPTRANGVAARRIRAKINLIPFNPWPGTKYECSDWGASSGFPRSCSGPATRRRCAHRADATSWLRGQLKSETEKPRARARLMLESGIGAEGVYAISDDA